MNKIINKIVAILLTVTILVGMTQNANAFSYDDEPLSITGIVNWEDDSNALGIRPESAVVYLYADGTLVGETIATAEDGWKYSFDISQRPVLNESGEFVQYTVSAGEVEHYDASYVMPEIGFYLPEDVIDKDNRITTCSSLVIPNEKFYTTILVVKKGHDYYVWTQDELSDAEKSVTIDQLDINGNPSYTFFAGEGAHESGITVTSNTVTFDEKSNWSWIVVDEFVRECNTNSSVTYTMDPDVKLNPTTAVISGTKTLDGELPENEQFSFELWYENECIEAVKNDAEGKFTFSELTFDAEGIYVYTVKEYIDSEDVTIDYDDSIYTVTVEVTREGLNYVADVAIVKIGDNNAGETNIVFNNVTVPKNPATVVIDGNKYLDGELSDKEFGFELWLGDELIETVTNNTNGYFVFTELTFDAEGTYVYTVKEVVDAEDVTIDYDETIYTVTVVVTLEGIDYLAEVTVAKNGEACDAIGFFNVTVPKNPATVVIDGNKYLDGKLSDKEFSFELWLGDELIETVTNNTNGYFAFTELTFDAEGTYVYTVKEYIYAEDVTIDYDEAVYTVTIVVTLEGIDYLAEVTVEKNGEACGETEFFNVTVPKNPTTVVIDGNKYLDGELSNKEFGFELWLGDELIETVTNNTNGYLVFTELTFDAEGTYVYTVKEVVDAEDVTIDYDEAIYTVTVVVTLEGIDYVAEVTVAKNDEACDAIGFFNVTVPKNPTTVVIDGNKYLDGELSDKEFGFELWLGDELIETVTNDTNGYLVFTELTFDAEGTYVYTVKEVIDAEDATIDYDENVYTVTVVVTLDGVDYLADTAITLGEDECEMIEFYNATKEEIIEEDPPLGSTAETVWTIFLVISLLGIVMTTMKKRAIQ